MKTILFLALVACSSFALAAEGLHHDSELGASMISGNSNSESYSFKQATQYGQELNTYVFSNKFVQARSATTGVGYVETAKSWDAALRYERTLSDMFSAFAAHSLESDIYAGYIQRNNYDLGAKYFFTKTVPTTWFAELGYRYVFEHGPAADKVKHTARVYSEVTQQINDSVTGRLWVEYIPSLSVVSSDAALKSSDDWYINAEPSVSVLLNKVFSLKTSYLFKYQNYIPAGSTKVRLDTLFLTALVAKF